MNNAAGVQVALKSHQLSAQKIFLKAEQDRARQSKSVAVATLLSTCFKILAIGQLYTWPPFVRRVIAKRLECFLF